MENLDPLRLSAQDVPAATLVSLVESAIAAPSADNHHHVLFELRPNGLGMLAGPGYLNCRERHRRILTRISFGCVLQNLTLAAIYIGYKVQSKWNPDPRRPELLANVHLVPLANAQAPSERVLAEMISVRHTNRRFFRRQLLTEETMALLRSEVAAEGGLELVWLTGSDRTKALRLARLAETERFRTRYLHQELFSAVHFEAGWKATCEEGLAPGSLGVEWGLQHAFGLLRHWPLMRVLNCVAAHYILGWRAGFLPCRLAPSLGVITVQGDLEQEAVTGGRSFQRMWLRAAALGLAVQPMAASVILPFYEPRLNAVSVALQRTLSDGWREILGGATAVMFFRAGYAATPTSVSGRKPVEQYLCRAD